MKGNSKNDYFEIWMTIDVNYEWLFLKHNTRNKEVLAFVPDLHLGVTNTQTSPTSPELDIEINFVQVPVLASSAQMLGWNTAVARSTPSITPNVGTFSCL